MSHIDQWVKVVSVRLTWVVPGSVHHRLRAFRSRQRFLLHFPLTDVIYVCDGSRCILIHHLHCTAWIIRYSRFTTSVLTAKLAMSKFWLQMHWDSTYQVDSLCCKGLHSSLILCEPPPHNAFHRRDAPEKWEASLRGGPRRRSGCPWPGWPETESGIRIPNLGIRIPDPRFGIPERGISNPGFGNGIQFLANSFEFSEKSEPRNLISEKWKLQNGILKWHRVRNGWWFCSLQQNCSVFESAIF